MSAPAIAYSQLWRIVTGALVAISRGSLVVLLAALLFSESRLDNPLRLLRTFVTLCLAPGLAAWLLARAFAATVAIEGGTLVIHRRDQRIEIPCDAIVRVVPWVVPLPGGGLWLGLRSGRRLPYGLQVSDPIALINAVADAGASDAVADAGAADAVADAGAADAVRAASRHPAAVYARSQAGLPRRWYQLLLKFVVFALVPALPLFRLHQWIAYGGTFGEYYTYGLQAYLLGFAIYWSTCTIYLLLYAAVLRAVAESMVLATVWGPPDRVAIVRRIVEIGDRLLYFGGVLAFLITLALAS